MQEAILGGETRNPMPQPPELEPDPTTASGRNLQTAMRPRESTARRSCSRDIPVGADRVHMVSSR